MRMTDENYKFSLVLFKTILKLKHSEEHGYNK